MEKNMSRGMVGTGGVSVGGGGGGGGGGGASSEELSMIRYKIGWAFGVCGSEGRFSRRLRSALTRSSLDLKNELGQT